MATSDYLSVADLNAASGGALINEDVMQRIWDISSIPLPFSNMVGSDTCKNSFFEWTTDKLLDPTLGGWAVDGADISQQDTKLGKRLGNRTGILRKEVQVTGRAQAVSTIGRSNELSYQLMMRQRELRRDVEANALALQGSQEDNGNATPGKPAGLGAMLKQFATGSGATGGGYNAGTKNWTAVTPGARVALTETILRDALQDAYEDGADISTLMTVPAIIRKLSNYLLSDTAKVATISTDQGTGSPAKAVGAVNVFLTDFGNTLRMIDNRLQQTYADSATATAAAVYLLDPSYIKLTYLRGYRVVDLAKAGDADKKMMLVDWSLRVTNPDACRVLLDINPTASVAA